jgi:hypothetical protein
MEPELKKRTMPYTWLGARTYSTNDAPNQLCHS